MIGGDLDEAAVRAAIEREARGWGAPVVVLAETESTNDVAKAMARAGAPAGAAVIADAQTAGRGRSGARWHSPAGENLYLSFVLRPELTPAAVAPFTLVVGLGVAKAVERRLGRPAGVKWPNDVLVGRRKIAGVLVEATARGGELSWMIVGVGVNVRAARFPEPLATLATSLAIEGARDLDRSRLAGEIVATALASSAAFADRGLAAFLDEIAERDALRGRPVEVGGLRGVAGGIDAAGRLSVRSDDGAVHEVVAGHVDVVWGDPPRS